MQNALRHGRPPVTATVSRAGGTVELRVRDHGPGVPENESTRVFEPFYRPSGRGEASGGWGLGLALVRQIAERHGGAVRYQAPSDGGACFVVSLPAHQ
jgi:signal transduction histidine kinase